MFWGKNTHESKKKTSFSVSACAELTLFPWSEHNPLQGYPRMGVSIRLSADIWSHIHFFSPNITL